MDNDTINCSQLADTTEVALRQCLEASHTMLRYTSVAGKNAFMAIHIIFTLVILGTNGVAITLYVVDKTLHTSYNLHILSVLTIDMCAGMFAIPSAMLIHTPSVEGDNMCKTYAFFLTYIEAVDVYSMVLIAAEKYLLLVLKPTTHRTLSQTATHVALVWGASFLYSLKDAFAYEAYRETHWDGGKVVYHTECRIMGGHTAMAEVYTILDALLLFCLPLVFICICYVRISVHLSKHTLSAGLAQNRTAVRLHMTVVVCFFFSAVGLHILRLYLTFGPGPFSADSLCNEILIAIAFSDFWINPLLYCYFNTNFRSSWVKLCSRIHIRGGGSSVITPANNGEVAHNDSALVATCRYSKYMKEEHSHSSSSKIFTVT